MVSRVPGVENLCLDCSDEANCHRVCEARSKCIISPLTWAAWALSSGSASNASVAILINTHMIEAAYRAGARRYFFSSSACAYNTLLQQDPNVRALKESDAYPAMAERGYGWEKLISEMFCEEYWHERGMKTFIARFHNVYGPNGTWDGGREKAPAALCRKIIEAIDTGRKDQHLGRRHQTRSFMYIDDCVKASTASCTATTSSPPRSTWDPASWFPSTIWSTKVEKIAGVKLKREYDLNAPRGVAGRNSDNTFIKKVLNGSPTPLWTKV